MTNARAGAGLTVFLFLAGLAAPSPSRAASEEACWGAVDVGVSADKKRITAGDVVNSPSEQQARTSALQACQKAGEFNCRVVATFSGKGQCAYVTTGSAVRGGGVSWGGSWGPGASAATALARCAQNGKYNCMPPAAACNGATPRPGRPLAPACR